MRDKSKDVSQTNNRILTTLVSKIYVRYDAYGAI